ncbi:MAG: MotA/TolQ/ExbB proton channel family protein [Gammaproteobacteria bacterium]|nr:MotA/TolQ/ExbB proton channel family protein [Gammaproteobacteria bacterium]
MKNFRNYVAGAVLCAAPMIAGNVFAADSLNDLLNDVQNVRSEVTRMFQQRAQEFNGLGEDAKAQQLREAQARRDELAATSETLSDQYSENEVRINDLNRQLRDKATELGLAELFGLARQAANDSATILEQSLITTQFKAPAGEKGRADFLRDFAASRATPTPADLERVWFEIQREMTASGQVARYQTEVVAPGGTPSQSEVVRVGPFTATSGGQFLQYIPTLQTLNIYPRQLPEEFMAIADDFDGQSSGYHTAVVDSARGVLLGLYVERPTLEERIELGEAVGYVIIVVGLLGLLAFLVQLVYLVIVRLGVSGQLKNLNNLKRNNALGRVLLAFKGDGSRIEQDADIAELRISEAVLREVPKLERFQAFLRLCVAAGPLLGLIGTVVGMIITFQSITESGSSDPKLMATGIGQAMIATVLGLGIAIPLLFANALLNSLSRGIVQILDEQSTGMLAEAIEKQRNV